MKVRAETVVHTQIRDEDFYLNVVVEADAVLTGDDQELRFSGERIVSDSLDFGLTWGDLTRMDKHWAHEALGEAFDVTVALQARAA